MSKLITWFRWTRLARWWRRGSRCIGRDDRGERMYSSTNGESILLWAILLACLAMWGVVLIWATMRYIR